MALVLSPSRYQRSLANQVQHPTDGSTRLAIESRAPVSLNDIGDDYWIHTTSEGDQLDALAHWHLGDPRLWWVLADLNRDTVTDFLRIPVGTKLVIPSESTLRTRSRINL